MALSACQVKSTVKHPKRSTDCNWSPTTCAMKAQTDAKPLCCQSTKNVPWLPLCWPFSIGTKSSQANPAHVYEKGGKSGMRLWFGCTGVCKQESNQVLTAIHKVIWSLKATNEVNLSIFFLLSIWFRWVYLLLLLEFVGSRRLID